MVKGKYKIAGFGLCGWGFVKSILDGRSFAVGIEGSDYSKLRKRAEWTTIPDYLFTADIAEPFQLLEVWEEESPLQFNVITAWEVMEHIKEDKIAGTMKIIDTHLSPQGVVIMSISSKEEIINSVRLHQTVRNQKWWIEKFDELGFAEHGWILSYFGHDWIRGRGIDDRASFNFVLTRKSEDLPYMVTKATIKRAKQATPTMIKSGIKRTHLYFKSKL